MIDTVCLLIPKAEMDFLKGVANWELYSKTEYYNKYVRNPSALEKEKGLYFPRLTGYKRKYVQQENVRIEFSVPKLLYLNNLDEVSDQDFEEVVTTLQNRLEKMGVILTKNVIKNASVSSVHFSKNIILENGYTASFLISEMNKVDLRKSFDFAKTRYINDGESLYAHTTAHQMVIYDKVSDLKKGKKRAIDKEPTKYQMSLFNQLKQRKTHQEIIRFEIRLARKQKMNKVLQDLGYIKNPHFKDIFSSQMSQRVVRDYWNKLIVAGGSIIFPVELSVKDVLQVMFLTDRELKPKKAIYLLGLYVLARDENGMRQLRAIVTKRMHDRTWYRMKQDMDYASELINKDNVRDWVQFLDRELKNYTPVKNAVTNK